VKALYTAIATASDQGRNGRAWTADHSLAVDLAVPEAMGGPGGGANPEQLFALGYAGCFANAMRSAARRQRREDAVEGATVTANVDIGRGGDGRFELAVKLDIRIPRLGQADAEAVVALADQRCPYSNATRGNIPVELVVTGGAAAVADA
jgi:lipoyl-dependent peroxiredoxin